MSAIVKEQKTALIVFIILIMIAIFLFGVDIIHGINVSYATEATSRKDTLSTSTPSEKSNHTIVFTTQDDITASSTVTIDFPDTFNGTTTDPFDNTDALDYDISTSTTDFTIYAEGGCRGSDDGTVAAFEITSTSTANVFTFTHCNGTSELATSSTITIEIGTNATNGGTGDSQLTNPPKVAAAGTADIYTVTIGGTANVSGDISIAIIDAITVSVTVAESLTFSVALVTNDNCDASGAPTALGTLSGPDSTAATVPFGTLSDDDTFHHACQDLTISTNATDGFTVTGQEDNPLKTSGGDTIADTTCDGASCSESSGDTDDWGTATNNGFGHTCVNTAAAGSGAPCHDDYDSTTPANCDATPCYRPFADISGGDTAATILTGNTATSSAVGRIEYKISISTDTQEAGDYTNVITYIATATF